MRVRVAFLSVAVLLLGGCASIPLSTMLHLSRLGPQSLARLDPAGVEVKFSTPKGWPIDVGSTRLALTVTDSSGLSRTEKMHVKLLRVTHSSLGGGLFSSPVAVTTYWFVLSEKGVHQLRQVQQFIQLKHPKNFNFNVNWRYSSCPHGANQVRSWVDLRLVPDKPFMKLIDGATIKFPKGEQCS